MGPVRFYFWATQGPPNSQKCTFLYIVAHIWKTGCYFFPLWWGLTGLKFSFTWVRHQDPPKYEKKCIFFSYFGFKLKISYQIVSLCDMYIDMGERIAGKQDRPSLIIEDPPPPQDPLNSPKYIFCFTFYILAHIWTNWFSNCFPWLYICLHCDEGCICWHFGATGTPGFYVGARYDPEKNIYIFFLF